MSLSIIFIMTLCGFLIATVSSSLGIGGGVFSFPLLLYTGRPFLPEEHLAIMGISGSLLMAVLFSASASYKNHQYQQIRYKHALAIAAGALPGSFLATNWAVQINVDSLVFIFAAFLALNGLRGLYRIFLIYRQKSQSETEQTPENPRPLNTLNWSILWFAGLLVGIASALTGIGGGVLMVPLLMNFMRLDPRDAISTSTFCILWITLVGSLGFQYQSLFTDVQLPDPKLGFLYLPLVLPLLAGGVLGGVAGSMIGNRVSPVYLRISLALLQVIIAGRMFYDAFI